MTRRERALFTWPALIARLHRPSPLALLPIDHLYAGAAWKTLAVRPLPRTGSDHFGILVTLARDPAAPPAPAAALANPRPFP
jgi:endonuclease/exonuclease/phosphatase (EEP) superfamily protein YafD